MFILHMLSQGDEVAWQAAWVAAAVVVVALVVVLLNDGWRGAFSSAVARWWAELDRFRLRLGGKVRLGGRVYKAVDGKVQVRRGYLLASGEPVYRVAWLSVGFARAAVDAGRDLEDYVPRDDPHPAGTEGSPTGMDARLVVEEASRILGVTVEEALRRPLLELGRVVLAERRREAVAMALGEQAPRSRLTAATSERVAANLPVRPLDAPAGARVLAGGRAVAAATAAEREERARRARDDWQAAFDAGAGRPLDAPVAPATRPPGAHAMRQEAAAAVEIEAALADEDEGF